MANQSNNMSYNAMQQLANANGQWKDMNSRVRSFENTYTDSNGRQQMLKLDPAACVRAPMDQFFSTKQNCVENLPPGYECNARYINGVWPYYMAFARDSSSCDGGIPPDILPQMLDSNAIVQNDSWYTLDNVLLKLMMDGHIGQLTFSTNVEGVMHTYDIIFNQQDYIAEDLYAPLIYRYSVLMSDLPPQYNQRVILEINLTSGYVTVTMPLGNGSALLKFVMTSILPAQPVSM